jgi:predicted 3-demethylubiquinone-9 3-methyltransferase (glyoxalase superfamily)
MNMTTTQKISTYLWFDSNAEQAVEHYLSLFPGSRVTKVARWGKGAPGAEGSVMTISFELAGQQFIALNGGPHFTFTPAISLFVTCQSQQEVDSLWNRIVEAGGKPSQCGWITDKFGLSWQIIPSQLMELMSDSDPNRSGRVAQALMGMVKIDIAALERAHANA